MSGMVEIDCRACKGTGRIGKSMCQQCRGSCYEFVTEHEAEMARMAPPSMRDTTHERVDMYIVQVNHGGRWRAFCGSYGQVFDLDEARKVSAAIDGSRIVRLVGEVVS